MLNRSDSCPFATNTTRTTLACVIRLSFEDVFSLIFAVVFLCLCEVHSVSPLWMYSMSSLRVYSSRLCGCNRSPIWGKGCFISLFATVLRLPFADICCFFFADVFGCVSVPSQLCGCFPSVFVRRIPPPLLHSSPFATVFHHLCGCDSSYLTDVLRLCGRFVPFLPFCVSSPLFGMCVHS